MFQKEQLYVFQSSRREEVIVSAYTVTPPYPSPEQNKFLDVLFENGLQAANITESDLRVTKPLAQEVGACDFPCWTVIAETPDRDALFAKALIRHRQGTVLLTYEAPFHMGAEDEFGTY